MTISRQAILIGSPKVNPELPGVRRDLQDTYDFLCSPCGGFWRKEEITILLDPNYDEVCKHINMAYNRDYVFILCSGHGEHRVGKDLDETVMYLQENEIIAVNELNPRNKRHFVMVDVCRGIVKVDEHRTKIALAKILESQSFLTIDCRKIYDEAVMANPEGRIVAYSCDINQSAGETPKGGIFTQEMLNAHLDFVLPNNSTYGILKIDHAFEQAKRRTQEKNFPQAPMLYAGRRRDFYPFAIKLR